MERSERGRERQHVRGEAHPLLSTLSPDEPMEDHSTNSCDSLVDVLNTEHRTNFAIKVRMKIIKNLSNHYQ